MLKLITKLTLVSYWKPICGGCCGDKASSGRIKIGPLAYDGGRRRGRDKWSNRMPGLLKLEFEGTRGITLCSKCYCMENEEKSKARLSSKVVSKRQNKLTWERYEAAFKGVEDKAINPGSGWWEARCEYIPKISWRWVPITVSAAERDPPGAYWVSLTKGRVVLGRMASSSSSTNPRFGPSCK